MTRIRPTGVLALAVAVLAIAVQVPARVSASTAAAPIEMLQRAFTARAEAFPTEPAPGSAQEPIAIRPHATVTEVANPPADAYARAAQIDLGLAESYFGAQGPRSEVDTTTRREAREQTVEESGSRLDTAVTLEPSASASARDASPSEATATATARSSSARVGDALVASAMAEIQSFALGPLTVGAGRFEAAVRIDGTPEGARASGSIVLTDTSVAGVPVVIGADGVRADATMIPLDLLDEATAQIQSALSQGGYADVRLVQPRIEADDEGSSAEVSGGGVFVYATNNDPANRYFLKYTLLGGRAIAVAGDALATTATPTTRQLPGASEPVGSAPRVAVGPSVASAPPLADQRSVEVGGRSVAIRSSSPTVVAFPAVWEGWWWVVAGAAIALVSGIGLARVGAVRRRLDDLLDGYVRG